MPALELSLINFWIVSCLFGLFSIVMLAMCAGSKNKKRNSITMIRYIKNEETETMGQRLRASTNGNGTEFTRETEHRLSQHSIPNENRILPEIPKKDGNRNSHGTPSTPDQVVTPAISLDGSQRNSKSSPKKSRRLPALPPGGNGSVDITQTSEVKGNSKEIDATYEDLRDDAVASVPGLSAETVGSGDSGLYARVPEDIVKPEDDSALYAQVGAAGETDVKKSKKRTSSSDKKRAGSSSSSSSDDDKQMDSPTVVTYASVDKMKKTMSIKRSDNPGPMSTKRSDNPGPVSSIGAPPPPVPDRNFDEEDENSLTATVSLIPPSSTVVQEIPSLSSALDTTHPSSQQGQITNEVDEQSGPAYDTVSVRESFAHQRLRQMVEDEQRNRYINTNPANGRTNNPDVYSQIEEENSEAVYESVSVPGSADGTVGITGRNLPNINTSGYANVGTGESGSITASSNRQIINPDYEDINPR